MKKTKPDTLAKLFGSQTMILTVKEHFQRAIKATESPDSITICGSGK